MTTPRLLPILVVLLLSPVVLAGCGGGGGAGSAGPAGRTVHVTARLPAASAQAPSGAWAAMAPVVAAPPDFSTAAKVILLGANGDVTVKPVTAGAVDFDAPVGSPIGVVFAGPADQYLGYLGLRGGIPALPLQAVADGVQRLDLGTLVQSGAVVQPGLDPIGSALALGDAEIAALSGMGFVFRMMVAHPDADGDGTIDWLQGRMYTPQVAFHRSGTMQGLTGGTLGPVEGWRFGYNVVEKGVASYPSTVTLTGPAGSGIVDATCPVQAGPYQNAYYDLGRVQPGTAPPAGTWSSSYAGRTVTFQMPDLGGLAGSTPALSPTVTLDAGGNVKSVSWRWQYPEGTVASSGPLLADQISVQLQASGAPTCAASNVALGPGQVYAMQFPATASEHVLACANIPWSAVSQLHLLYIDVFNTLHESGFTHAAP